MRSSHRLLRVKPVPGVQIVECSAKEESEKKIRRKRGRGRFVLVCFQKVIPSTFPRSHPYSRLVPSRFLTVFWDERRLGIRSRRARGVMGREEGKIATLFVLLPFP